ncbi:MAG: hypothetical protein ACXVC7_12075 [Bacteroidia bacterium]
MRNFKFKLPFFRTKSPLKTEEKNEEMNTNENNACSILNTGLKNEDADSSTKNNNQNNDGFDTYLNVRPWG